MNSKFCTKEESWRLSILKAQNGDKEERDALVNANLGLIYMVLKRFTNRGYEIEDLFQIGAIGLLKAIDKFDVSRELSFSTYAVPMIIGEIRRFLRDDGMLHISRQIKENARKIAIVKEQLKKEANYAPTMEELKKATGLSEEAIVTAMEATVEVESIFQPVSGQKEGSQLMLIDQIEDKTMGEVQIINSVTVQQLLGQLNETERKLIVLRYLDGKTQTESATILGMNQVAVSRLEKKILLQLRNQF